MTTALAVQGQVVDGFEMKPRTMEEAMKFCEIMAKSDLVPKDYKDKPGNIMVAIQMGAELGLTPIRALRCIAVINGRASMWGDEMLAMVLASPVCEYVDESASTDKEGVCKTKRKGFPELVTKFSLADATAAGLLGKAGTWQTNRPRMLKLRARGFGLRDNFADVLAGLVSAEEALDLPRVEAEAGLETILEANQPLTLKDKLKAKVEAIGQPHDTVQGDGLDTGSTSATRDAALLNAPANQDASAPTIFDQSSAYADHEIALQEFSDPVAGQKAWEDVVVDKRVTAEQKPKLYQVYQRRLKAVKGK